MQGHYSKKDLSYSPRLMEFSVRPVHSFHRASEVPWERFLGNWNYRSTVRDKLFGRKWKRFSGQYIIIRAGPNGKSKNVFSLHSASPRPPRKESFCNRLTGQQTNSPLSPHKGPYSATPLFLFTRESLAIKFYSEHVVKRFKITKHIFKKTRYSKAI